MHLHDSWIMKHIYVQIIRVFFGIHLGSLIRSRDTEILAEAVLESDREENLGYHESLKLFHLMMFIANLLGPV